MKTLIELERNECRFALTDPPVDVQRRDSWHTARHLFCGEATAEGQQYCPTHKAVCHRGPGKDWQGLAEMIRHTEQTVRTSKTAADVQQAVDTVVAAPPVEPVVAPLAATVLETEGELVG